MSTFGMVFCVLVLFMLFVIVVVLSCILDFLLKCYVELESICVVLCKAVDQLRIVNNPYLRDILDD